MATYAQLLADRNTREAFVLAIEGIKAYFATQDVSAVWADRTVHVGLTVRGSLETSIKPTSADVVKSDALEVEIVDSAAVQAIFAPTPGLTTYAASSIESSATTIDVQSPYTLAGWPASGTIYVGTECMTYAARTDSQFQGLARGLYPPVGNSECWQQRHCLSDRWPEEFPLEVRTVADHFGRRAALYHVLYDPTAGAWLSKANSEVLWVGRISALAYDGAGLWRLSLKHLGEDLARPLFAEPFSGATAKRVDIAPGDYLVECAYKYVDAAGILQGAPYNITVTIPSDIADRADGAAVIMDAFTVALNSTYPVGWPAAERFHTFSVRAETRVPEGGDYAYFECQVPVGLSAPSFYIRLTSDPAGTLLGSYVFDACLHCGDHFSLDGLGTWRHPGGPQAIAHLSETPISYTVTTGHPIIAQAGSGAFAPQPEVGANRGFVKLEQSEGNMNTIVAVERTGGTVANPEFEVDWAWSLTALGQLFRDRSHSYWRTEHLPVSLKQVWVPSANPGFENPADFLLAMLVSTGGGVNVETGGINYDYFGAHFGAGIPDCLINHESFLAAIGSYRQARTYCIDEPISAADLLRNECAVAARYPVWVGQRLELRPLALQARARPKMTLSNANKAGSARPSAKQSTECIITGWQVHADYDPLSGQWRYKVPITNPTAARTWHVNKEGQRIEHYGIHRGETAASIEEIGRNIASQMYLFGKPRWIVKTTGNQTTMRLAAGDLVLLTEQWVPAPFGGVGTETTMAALVLSTSYSLADKVNTLTLLIIEDAYMLAPSWRLSAYDGAVTVTIDPAVYGDLYTGDGFAYLAPGDKVRIIEADPVNPDAPTYWDRTVDTVSAPGTTHSFTVTAPFGALTPGMVYNVVFQGYSAVATRQQAFTFLADDATGYVTGTIVYRYS